MDVVYILGNGSRWSDNEFKYSLRSVAKHLKGFSRVVVIGSLPRCEYSELDTPFLFIPFADRDGDKQRNARNKLLHVCDTAEISEQFLLMNDDFFVLQDCDVVGFPYFRQGTLTQHIEWREHNPSNYLKSLRLTERALKEKKLPIRDFEIHCPIVYRKAELKTVLTTEFDWNGAKEGMLIRSLFANYLKIEGTVLSDLKLDSPHPRFDIERRTAGRPFFSVGDGGLNPDMKAFLKTRFPGGEPAPRQHEVSESS